MKNADLMLSLLISLLNKAAETGAMISRARSEGRDVSDAELDVLSASADASSAALKAEIAKQRGEVS